MNNLYQFLVKIVKIRSNRHVDALPLFSPNGVPLPVLRNVPVALLGNEKNHSDFNVAIGDIMPYQVCAFDISSYTSQGSLEIMDSTRRNNINSGYIMPFTIPNMKTGLEFPSSIRVIGDREEKGNVELEGNTSQTGNVNLTGNTSQSGNVSVTGSVGASEDVSVAGKSTKNHTHRDSVGGNTGVMQ